MKNLSILFTVIFLTATFLTTINGQDIKWDQYSGNPIIKPSTSGWNHGMVSAPTVIMFNDTLRMWYEGSTAYGFDGTIHIGYAWSPDGITWHQYSENPVFSPRQGEWDYPHIFYPFVIADGDTLRMWYGGGDVRLGNLDNNEVMRIGYATSVDGINWNRYPEPVIEPPSPTAWDQDGVLPGGVIKEDGIFKMWFNGGVGPLGYPPATSKWSIGYATSSDCIHWDLLPDPVISHGDSSTDFDESAAGHAYVTRTNAGYDMWYSGHSHTAVVNSKPQGKIGYASSSDGIFWAKYDKNPVLSPTSVSIQWTTGYYAPSVYFDGVRFHMWFTGWNESNGFIAIGYATSLLDTSHYPPGITNIIAEQPYIDKTFAQKNVDSVLFRTRFLNNYNHHFTANLVYSNLGNTLRDSVTLYDDGQHGDALANDGLYGTYIPPVPIEDFYSLGVSTLDQQTNKYIYISQLAYFTTVGPVVLDSVLTRKSTQSKYNVQLFLKNDSESKSIEHGQVRLLCDDPWVKGILPSILNLPNIGPGGTATRSFNIETTDTLFHSNFNLTIEVLSNQLPFWYDSTTINITGVDDNIPLPLSYNLSQNYPNPFNPSTIINFVIPKSSFVNLSVYDILGRKISTLINEEKPAGTYGLTWDAANLPSGVYFYKIQAGSFIQTKKMILMK